MNFTNHRRAVVRVAKVSLGVALLGAGLGTQLAASPGSSATERRAAVLDRLLPYAMKTVSAKQAAVAQQQTEAQKRIAARQSALIQMGASSYYESVRTSPPGQRRSPNRPPRPVTPRRPGHPPGIPPGPPDGVPPGPPDGRPVGPP